MDRESHLLSLRPQLNTLSDNENTKSIEAFQNGVIRPILKFQNPLTLALIKAHPHFSSEKLKDEKWSTHITSLCKEVRMQNQLIGLVIALMTATEFEVYSQAAKEYNKRIITMQIKRYLDQLD